MPNTPPNLIAGGAIRPHRFVKMDTAEEHQGLECDANDAPIGIAGPPTLNAPMSDLVTTNNAAADGDSFLLKGPGEYCQLEAGASFNSGTRLKADADGKGVAVATSGTTIQQWGAISQQAAAADGDLVEVFVELGSERPALS